MTSRLFVLFLLALIPAASAQKKPMPLSSPSLSSRVLVIRNSRSEDSLFLTGYYIRKRKIPAANVVTIACPTEEECSRKEYDTLIKAPVQAFLAKTKQPIDFLLLTRGVPIRVKEGGFCVDSLLAAMDWTLLTTRTPNPYYAKEARFSHKKFGLYLASRLDGYTREDCIALVDRALAAKPEKGPFLLDVCPGRDKSSYIIPNDSMRTARQLLEAKQLEVLFDDKQAFVGSDRPLMGYFSWGSNDFKYDKKTYNSLKFLPGALAETVVSSSGRTVHDPKNPGQSLIADLIAQGVTGCKGYVSEPYVDAIAGADTLFDRYTSGYTLAESFFAASRYVYWKDLVLGDPICAPYAK